MPYGIFITAHGGRGVGTSLGTYVIPPGVSVYSFTDDAVLLKGNMGMAVEDRLTLPSLNVPLVKTHVKNVNTGFEIIPNYTAFGSTANDPAFQFATGVYYVGSNWGDPPALALNDGQQARLGDIIAAFKKSNGTNPSDVFWLCCRAVPQNANKSVDVSVDAFGTIEEASDSGLRPSEVVANFGIWR